MDKDKQAYTIFGFLLIGFLFLTNFEGIDIHKLKKPEYRKYKLNQVINEAKKVIPK